MIANPIQLTLRDRLGHSHGGHRQGQQQQTITLTYHYLYNKNGHRHILSGAR